MFVLSFCAQWHAMTVSFHFSRLLGKQKAFCRLLHDQKLSFFPEKPWELAEGMAQAQSSSCIPTRAAGTRLGH